VTQFEEVKYRLYVDEVGNPDLGSSERKEHRYLSLTGLVIGLDHVKQVVHPALEGLKIKYFRQHPDEPIILHRKEIINKKPPFHGLRDPGVEKAFNDELLELLTKLEYCVFTVVIDKLEHKQRYRVWHHDPYHYCMEVLVERFVFWLKDHNAIGDVMAESRGGKEDRRLKDSFHRLFTLGTNYLGHDIISRHLTSCRLKIKHKYNNIAGLQLADLIAHPSFKAYLARRERKALPRNFGGRIAAILQRQKYHRSPTGAVEGWGRKWLP